MSESVGFRDGLGDDISVTLIPLPKYYLPRISIKMSGGDENGGAVLELAPKSSDSTTYGINRASYSKSLLFYMVVGKAIGVLQDIAETRKTVIKLDPRGVDPVTLGIVRDMTVYRWWPIEIWPRD